MPAPDRTEFATPGHVQGLDGLRAVAATMVFWLHASGHADATLGTLDLGDRLWRLNPGFGANGVSLFFVLSGFLLCGPYWQALIGRGSVDFRAYVIRRLHRIYPAYFLAVVILAVIHDVNHPYVVRATHVITHLLMLHNLSEATIYSLSVPLWSVATEFQLYLALPALFVGMNLLARYGLRPQALAALLVIATGFGAHLFVALAAKVLGMMAVDPRLVRLDGVVLPHSVIAGLPDFAVGIACGLAHGYLVSGSRPDGSRFPWIVEVGAVSSIALCAFLAHAYNQLGGTSFFHWPLVSLAFGGLVLSVSLSSLPYGIAAFLDLPPIRWLGLVSYSFYLYHDVVLWNVFNKLPGLIGDAWLPGRMELAALSYILTLLVAWTSYRFIEQRFRTRRPGTVGPPPAMSPVT